MTPPDRIKDLFMSLVRAVIRPERYAAWEFTVQASDFGSVDVVPSDAALAAGFGPMTAIECWSSVIGGRSKINAGTPVTIMFRNGDFGKPFVVSMAPSASAQVSEIDLDADTKINIGGGTNGAARVSDAVTGSGPTSCTGTVVISPPTFTGESSSGTVHSGSTKVVIG